MTAPLDPGIRLHRKQYVVGRHARPLASDWLEVPLGDDLWLSHCPDLRTQALEDGDGRRWMLLGLAADTSQRCDPTLNLSTVSTGDVARTYERWAGRWALIGRGEIHLDATAQLGCHYGTDGAGRTWASSSPAALIDVISVGGARGDGAGSERPLDLVYERGLSWVAPPFGRRTGVRRLLPSEILDVASGRTRPRRLAVPADELGAELAGGGGLAAFGTALGAAMGNLPAELPKSLALTAGADSRVVLAAARAAGIELSIFTRRAARMSVADRVVPPRLADAVGLAHREVVAGKPDPARMALAMAHTDHHVSAGDALPFVTGVRDGFVGVEIGGQGFGAGKVKNRHFPAEIGDPAVTAELVADHFGEPPRSPNRAAVAAWLAIVARQHDEFSGGRHVDWRDRFYLEQRTGGWQAAKEQLYDLHGHERFFPINCARTLGLILSVDEDRRSDGAHRTELIAMLDDRLLVEPFNKRGDEFSVGQRLAHALTVDPGRPLRRLRQAVRGA